MGKRVSGPFASAGREVVIAEAVRTPIGKAHPQKGWYRDVHPNAMLAACYQDLVARSGIDPIVVEDLIIGCTAPFGEQSRNIGRNAWLQAGYPAEVPATTLDRRCGSAQTAVNLAAALVSSGIHDVVHRRRRRAHGPRADELPGARSANSTASRGPPSCGRATTSSPRARAPN